MKMSGKIAILASVAALSVATVATTAFADTGGREKGSSGDSEAPYGGTATTALRIRTLPTAKSTPDGSFKKGAHVGIYCQTEGVPVRGEGTWYMVNSTDGHQWVSARYVDLDGKAPEACSDAGGRYNGKVTADRLAVRAEPSVKAEKVDVLKSGEKVEYICRVDILTDQKYPTWYQTYDGTWIAATYIKNDDSLGKPPYCSH